MTSWITGLAGKAEDLLNRVDQTAATALSKTDEEHRTPSPRSVHERHGHRQDDSPYSTTSSANMPSNMDIASSSVGVPSSTLSSNTGNNRTEVGKQSVQKHQKDIEEELFEFLNSPDSVDNGTRSRPDSHVNTVLSSTNTHSRQSSASSTLSGSSFRQGSSTTDNFVFVSGVGENDYNKKSGAELALSTP